MDGFFFYFLLLCIAIFWMLVYNLLCICMFFTSIEYIPRSGIAGSYNSMFNLWGTARVSHSGCTYFLTAVYENCSFSTSLLPVVCLFDYSHAGECGEWYLVWFCFVPPCWSVMNIFSCAYWPLLCHFWRSVYSTPLFILRYFYYLVLRVLFMYCEYKSFIQENIRKNIFSLSMCYILTFLMVFFGAPKFLILVKSKSSFWVLCMSIDSTGQVWKQERSYQKNITVIQLRGVMASSQAWPQSWWKRVRCEVG